MYSFTFFSLPYGVTAFLSVFDAEKIGDETVWRLVFKPPRKTEVVQYKCRGGVPQGVRSTLPNDEALRHLNYEAAGLVVVFGACRYADGCQIQGCVAGVMSGETLGQELTPRLRQRSKLIDTSWVARHRIIIRQARPCILPH